jgi:photosystem II stability/assembly factor-like uncharacterized protein
MNSSFSRVRFVLPVIAVLLAGAGCFGPATPAKGPDGGVWKSSDSGATWVQKKALVVSAKVTGSVGGFSITSMALDPEEHTAVYAGTRSNGLIASLDGGESWTQTKISGTVNAVVVDPKNKCAVYAASQNKIYKTTTCGRDWTQIFFDPRTDKIFTQLAIDWYNPLILFAGSSDGDIFRSNNAGMTWQTVKRVDGVKITSIAVDPRDSRLLYVGTEGEGIFRSNDGGTSWMQIKKQFSDDLSTARRVVQVVVDPVEKNVVYTVSKYGILKSTDGGTTWKPLTLTTPPGSVKIASLAIDPKNNHHLIYTGTKVLERSMDGGKSWSSQKLPTSQNGSVVLIDPISTNLVYLGTAAPVQQ